VIISRNLFRCGTRCATQNDMPSNRRAPSPLPTPSYTMGVIVPTFEGLDRTKDLTSSPEQNSTESLSRYAGNFTLESF
jgi:hypothetical protein